AEPSRVPDGGACPPGELPRRPALAGEPLRARRVRGPAAGGLVRAHRAADALALSFVLRGGALAAQLRQPRLRARRPARARRPGRLSRVPWLPGDGAHESGGAVV